MIASSARFALRPLTRRDPVTGVVIDLVPDYLTSVQENGFYGWPFSYYGQHLDPRVKPLRPDLVAWAIKPDYALSSHVAPLGVIFSDATSLPAAFRSDAIVGEHASTAAGIVRR